MRTLVCGLVCVGLGLSFYVVSWFGLQGDLYTKTDGLILGSVFVAANFVIAALAPGKKN